MALRIFNRGRCGGSITVLQRFVASERLLSTAVEAAVSHSTNEKELSASEESVKEKDPIQPFRVKENDPTKHNLQHYARLYTVPPEIIQKLFKPPALPKNFAELCKTFTETCIMVRKPYLELLDHFQRINFSQPAVRFVLYGKSGHGKSVTLAHVLHYGFNTGYLLVHVPWVNSFMKHCREVNPSETKPGMFDAPVDASNWLLHFKTQNEQLLSDLNLTTTKAYEWGPREVIPDSSPLIDLINFGISRSKFACDVIEVLLKEIKSYSTQGRFKTMVIIDGFNGLLCPYIVMKSGKSWHKVQSTMALPFWDIASYDWVCNGVIVLSVDRLAQHQGYKLESDLPLHLLGKQGWEHLDPFIPIKVDKYEDAEINTILDYFIDRHWIQHPLAKTPAGRAELACICGGDPLQLTKICSSL